MRGFSLLDALRKLQVLLVLFICGALSSAVGLAQGTKPPVSEPRKQSTVGSVGRLNEVLLPGSLLRVKPLENRDAPIIVRIVDSFPHGDSFRYNFTYMALEPGRYDLRDSLERVDGTLLGDVPEIAVDIVSVLEAGHIPPHDLALSWPKLGSYRFWVILGAVFWVLVLLAMIFWPKRRDAMAAAQAKVFTLAGLLQPRLQAAASGQLDSRQLAELERWLVEFWRRRLGLHELQPRQALIELRQHELAGPVLQQLERWLHSPGRDTKAPLSELLAPYAGLEVPGELEASLRRSMTEPTAGANT
ncbi:MAG: hypothetical protein Q8M16_21330 [Pirellulaceae bacterium]|nr:hypothetical protein [Pirellulaceae bacterium]